MKSTASLAAFLLIATAAHAQAGYEQLSPAARKAYDACTDAAASKPTTEGVPDCDEHLQSPLSPGRSSTGAGDHRSLRHHAG